VANYGAGYGAGLRNDEELGHVNDAGKEARLEMMSADVVILYELIELG
jgi:hypothetical protein